MAAIGFPEHAKSAKLPSGVTYSYVHIRPASAAKPTVLFLHGFPSSSWDWRHQTRHVAGLGYGVLAPDLLGYGDTDKPDDPAAYAFKISAGHVAELLEHEGLDKVHGVGGLLRLMEIKPVGVSGALTAIRQAHDFGSTVLSRLVAYHPGKLLSCTFCSVPYIPPGTPFNLDEIKKMTEAVIGFEKLGYMRFLSREDSWKVLEEHAASPESLLYGKHNLWIEHVYPAGALENWTLHDRMAPPSTYVTAEEMAVRRRIFAAGGYRAPTNWYRMQVGELGLDEERRDAPDLHVRCPVLLVNEGNSPASLPGMDGAAKEYAADLRIETVSTPGHWVQLEAREEVNDMLTRFLDEVDKAMPKL